MKNLLIEAKAALTNMLYLLKIIIMAIPIGINCWLIYEVFKAIISMF